jgi:AcrR family transcriptional regulator
MLETPSRNRIAERREATRAEVLNAAWAVARESGLATLTLRDVAQRVGMRAPSLYSYFASKNEIYDAMFGQAWTEILEISRERVATLPESARGGLKVMARTFFEFAVADLPRNQLMNQRTIPGFEPSADSYRPAIETLEIARRNFARYGIPDPRHVDLYTALIGGLIDSQQANDPGGDRWARLLDEAIDMFADHVGVPAESPTRRSRT